MSVKLSLAGDSIIFSAYYQYNPFTTVRELRKEGPAIQQAFRDHEMAVRGRTPKQPVVEEAIAAVEVVPQPVVEAVPTAPVTPIIVPTTPPPSTPTAEVPKRKLVLKLKDTTPKAKPKLVLRNQPSQ